MTKGPPEYETAAKDTGPGGGDNEREAGAATLRGYVLDAHLILIEARYG